jgi:hypothetical protein
VSEDTAKTSNTQTAIDAGIMARPEAMRPLADALRSNAAFIRSFAFSPREDTEWFAASLDRLAARADALATANKAQHDALKEAARLLRRYRAETPLGHQPHMIAHEADAAIARAAALSERSA